ncbi:transcriptional regulator, partial [Coemansia sp. S610]
MQLHDFPLPREGEASAALPAFSSDNIAQFRKQVHAFRRVSRNMPLLPQLRKICNHPFVFEQVESRINPTSVTDSLIYHSASKFELLDRVLSKLLATDHR